MNKTVEVVRGQNKAVSLLHRAPPAQHEVACEAVLERPRQMFVENRIEIVIICSRVADLELAGESGVAVVGPLGVVVPLPELDGTDVGADEDGGAQEGVEGGGEDAGEDGLQEQHGRVGHGEGAGQKRGRLIPS